MSNFKTFLKGASYALRVSRYCYIRPTLKAVKFLAYWGFTLAMALGYATFLTGRNLRSWVDGYIDRCLEKPQEPIAPLKALPWGSTKLAPDPSPVVLPSAPYLLPSVPSPIGLLCGASDVPKVTLKAKAGRPKGSKDRSPRKSKKVA